MNKLLREALLSAVKAAGFDSDHFEWLCCFHDGLQQLGLEVNSHMLLDAVVRHPSLVSQKPATLIANVRESARLLELSETQFTKAALKHPPLFCQRPATLHRNAQQSAHLIGIDFTKFASAALRRPSLFCIRPATLHGNVRESARLLELSETQFTAVALMQPALFYQRPKTLRSKVPYVQRIAGTLGVTEPLASLLVRSPMALSLSTQYLHARYVIAKLGLKRGAVSSVIGMTTAAVTQLLIAHFSSKIARCGSGARALQVMRARRIISTLPRGIEPIAPPTHSRTSGHDPAPK